MNFQMWGINGTILTSRPNTHVFLISLMYQQMISHPGPALKLFVTIRPITGNVVIVRVKGSMIIQ